MRRARLSRRLGLEGLPSRPARSAGTRCRKGSSSRSSCREPIFTPATKAQTGHDENIDRAAAVELVGEERFDEVEAVALALYSFVSDYARERGIILADTKLEFGIDERRASSCSATRRSRPTRRASGRPTSTRPGGTPPSFDKQFVRDYCESLGWDKTAPGPELPDAVVTGTRARYVEAFERLTGIGFDDYLADPSVVLAMRATVLVRPKPGILDPQGQAVESSLRHLGFEVSDARVGRLVDVERRDRRQDGGACAARADVRAAADEPVDREL